MEAVVGEEVELAVEAEAVALVGEEAEAVALVREEETSNNKIFVVTNPTATFHSTYTFSIDDATNFQQRNNNDGDDAVAAVERQQPVSTNKL